MSAPNKKQRLETKEPRGLILLDCLTETPKFKQLLPGNGGLTFTLARLLLLKHHRSLELLYALKLEGILRFC
ncbi:MAG: hypothetical protein P8J27_05135 [Mariniblastus sp.]|nr:hypothetical protein [Mariniblastus sp.]